MRSNTSVIQPTSPDSFVITNLKTPIGLKAINPTSGKFETQESISIGALPFFGIDTIFSTAEDKDGNKFDTSYIMAGMGVGKMRTAFTAMTINDLQEIASMCERVIEMHRTYVNNNK